MAMERLTRGIGMNYTSRDSKQALPNSDVDYRDQLTTNLKDFEEFQGFVGLSKDIHERVKSPYIQRIRIWQALIVF